MRKELRIRYLCSVDLFYVPCSPAGFRSINSFLDVTETQTTVQDSKERKRGNTKMAKIKDSQFLHQLHTSGLSSSVTSVTSAGISTDFFFQEKGCYLQYKASSAWACSLKMCLPVAPFFAGLKAGLLDIRCGVWASVQFCVHNSQAAACLQM